jgi:FtsH-binding integral membrane protein
MFENVMVNGVALMALVVGLVEFGKRFGLHGKWCILAAAILGLGFGAASQLQTSIPTTWVGWFGVIVWSLSFALAACGVYEVNQKKAEDDRR